LALSQDAPPRRSTGGRVAPVVLLHEVQSFDRHEELVVAGVPQLEKFLERVADADLLQTDERADPMIDVNDEIADLQITQIRKKTPWWRIFGARARADPLEDVGFGRKSADQRPAAGSRERARRWRRAPPRTGHLRPIIGTANTSYSFNTSMVRSARPAVAATKSVVWPSSRRRRIPPSPSQPLAL